MKNKIITEEIDRIKLLISYNLKNTLTENKKVVVKNSLLKEGIIGTTAETLFKDLAKIEGSGLRNSIENALKETGSITIKDGRGIAYQTRDVDEIIRAMEMGTISSITEAGRLAKELFRKSTDLEVKSLAAEAIVNMKSFDKKFGNMTREQMVKELEKKYTREEAEQLANKYSKNKTKKPVPKPEPKPEPKLEPKPKPKPEPKPLEDFPPINKEVESEIKSYTEIKTDIESKPNKVLEWLERRGIWDPVKRVIKAKALIKLALLTGIGVGIWYLFFKKKGNAKIECEQEGFEFSVEANDCVRKGSSDDDDQTQITDDEGNVYTDCNVEYHIGCKTPKGSEDLISKAQSCLGVKVTGLFNKETEIALSKKINQVSFTKDDIKYICRSGLGSTLARL